MKKKSTSGSLEDQVRERLGKDRIDRLATQPPCLALGGIDEVLRAACGECAGHPQPHASAAVRVLQLCGSTPTAADSAD